MLEVKGAERPDQIDVARHAFVSGNDDTARPILERIVHDGEPGWAEAALMLAGVHNRAGEKDAARTLLQRLAIESPAQAARAKAE